MQNQPLSLLFYGHFYGDPNTFNRDTAKDIRFNKKVVVKSIRVCAPDESPHAGLVKFTGESSPKQIGIEVFAKTIEGTEKPLVSLSSGPMQFTVYKGKKTRRKNLPVKTVLTDHIFLRGTFDTLSICVYGYVVEEAKDQAPAPLVISDLDFFSEDVLKKTVFDPFLTAPFKLLRIINLHSEVGEETNFEEYGELIQSLVTQFESNGIVKADLELACAKLANASEEWVERADRDVQDLISMFLYQIRDRINLVLHFDLLTSICKHSRVVRCFIQFNGTDLLYEIIVNGQCQPNEQIAALRALRSLLRHPEAMDYFLARGNLAVNLESSGYRILVALMVLQPEDSVLYEMKVTMHMVSCYEALRKLYSGMALAESDDNALEIIELVRNCKEQLQLRLECDISQHENLHLRLTTRIGDALDKRKGIFDPIPNFDEAVINYCQKWSFFDCLLKLLALAQNVPNGADLGREVCECFCLLAGTEQGLRYLATHEEFLQSLLLLLDPAGEKNHRRKLTFVQDDGRTIAQLQEHFDFECYQCSLKDVIVRRLQAMILVQQLQMGSELWVPCLFLLDQLAHSTDGCDSVAFAMYYIEGLPSISKIIQQEANERRKDSFSNNSCSELILTILVKVTNSRFWPNIALEQDQAPNNCIKIQQELYNLKRTTLRQSFMSLVKEMLDLLTPTLAIRQKGFEFLCKIIMKLSEKTKKATKHVEDGYEVNVLRNLLECLHFAEYLTSNPVFIQYLVDQNFLDSVFLMGETCILYFEKKMQKPNDIAENGDIVAETIRYDLHLQLWGSCLLLTSRILKAYYDLGEPVYHNKLTTLIFQTTYARNWAFAHSEHRLSIEGCSWSSMDRFFKGISRCLALTLCPVNSIKEEHWDWNLRPPPGQCLEQFILSALSTPKKYYPSLYILELVFKEMQEMKLQDLFCERLCSKDGKEVLSTMWRVLLSNNILFKRRIGNIILPMANLHKEIACTIVEPIIQIIEGEILKLKLEMPQIQLAEYFPRMMETLVWILDRCSCGGLRWGFEMNEFIPRIAQNIEFDSDHTSYLLLDLLRTCITIPIRSGMEEDSLWLLPSGFQISRALSHLFKFYKPTPSQNLLKFLRFLCAISTSDYTCVILVFTALQAKSTFFTSLIQNLANMNDPECLICLITFLKLLLNPPMRFGAPSEFFTHEPDEELPTEYSHALCKLLDWQMSKAFFHNIVMSIENNMDSWAIACREDMIHIAKALEETKEISFAPLCDMPPVEERFSHPNSPILPTTLITPHYCSPLQKPPHLDKPEDTFAILDARLMKKHDDKHHILSPLNERVNKLLKRPIIDKFRTNSYTGGRPPSIHMDDFNKKAPAWKNPSIPKGWKSTKITSTTNNTGWTTTSISNAL